jgi:hypothetical protein
LGPNGSFGYGATTDGVWLPTVNGGDGSIHLTTAYGIRGAFNHNWDPYWSSSLFGGMGWVRYDATARTEYCAVYTAGITPGANFTCNPNYSMSMLGFVTRWTPVPNLTFSAEALWAHLNTANSGSMFTTAGLGGGTPGGTYTFANQDTLSFNVRAQRNF